MDCPVKPGNDGCMEVCHTTNLRVITGLDPVIHSANASAMKQFYVYILASKKNGTLYVGVTSDIRSRTFQHRSGLVDGFTKQHSVKRLVHLEHFPDAENAIRREKAIKKWPRRWKVALIEKANPDWNDLFPSLNA